VYVNRLTDYIEIYKVKVIVIRCNAVNVHFITYIMTRDTMDDNIEYLQNSHQTTKMFKNKSDVAENVDATSGIRRKVAVNKLCVLNIDHNNGLVQELGLVYRYVYQGFNRIVTTLRRIFLGR